ncbi:MAG: glucose 1-dehydrogenase [Chthonomonadales bacterium]
MSSEGYLSGLFSLMGKNALVTGSSGGIGTAITLGLAQAGAKVAIHGTNRANLEKTLELVEAAGGEGVIVTADLRDSDESKALAAQANEALGGLDILVNNAGMNRRMRLLEFSDDDFDTIMSVNLRNLFFLTQAAHPFIKARDGGKVINIGSMTTFIGLGNVGVYGMSKSALGQLTRTMAVEWAEDNIQVNCIAPGFIKTPLTAVGQWADPVKARWILDRVPAHRAGRAEDMVGTAVLLASAASGYLTGQTVAIDGGFLAGGQWDPWDVTDERLRGD